MIRVDRNKVAVPVIDPPGVRSGNTELQRIREHRAGADAAKAFEFAVYKSAAVKDALERLFHGKCAYCESFFATTQPVDVEHYRPKGGVEGIDGHPGYWWLAMVWTNLLPSCIDCNRRRDQLTPHESAASSVALAQAGNRDRWRKLSTGKATAFPLEANSPRAATEEEDYDLSEKRLLLDPTRDEPSDHIGFYVNRNHLVSLVHPLALGAADRQPILPAHDAASGLAVGSAVAGVSAKGAVSIQVYGLNRLGLVQARTRLLRDLEFMLEISLGLDELAIDLDDRLAARGALLPTNSSIQEEIDFLERIKLKIEAHRRLIRDRLSDALAPTAPYSALARAWARAFVDGPA